MSTNYTMINGYNSGLNFSEKTSMIYEGIPKFDYFCIVMNTAAISKAKHMPQVNRLDIVWRTPGLVITCIR